MTPIRPMASSTAPPACSTTAWDRACMALSSPLSGPVNCRQAAVRNATATLTKKTMFMGRAAPAMLPSTRRRMWNYSGRAKLSSLPSGSWIWK